MPITNTNFLLVAVTATLLVPADSMSQEVIVQNFEKTSIHQLFIGNASVTVNNGLNLPHTDRVALSLGPGDSLYGISAVADLNVRVLVVKQD